MTKNSSVATSTTSCLENTLLCTIVQSAGQSNTEVLPWDANTTIREALPQIEEELEVLEQEIAELRSRRSRILNFVHRLKIAWAPHKRLPLEVLTHIFTMTAEDSELSMSDVQAYPAWPIRSVCSHWRKVVLEHRTLWNAITLEPVWRRPLAHDGGDGRTRGWKNQITRALYVLPSETDVSITLRLTEANDRLVDFAFEKLVQPLSSRLCKLVLIESDLRALGDLFQMSTSTHFPTLTTLELILGEGIDDLQDFEWLNRAVSDNGILTESGSEVPPPSATPNLRSLSITWESPIGFEELLQGLQNQICWISLTCLELRGGDYHPMDYDHLLPVLKAAMNLTRLSLVFDEGLDDIAQTRDMVTFPHLQHLHVKSIAPPIIFDFLTLPSLKHLIIDTVEDGCLQSILAMIFKSPCFLISFEERSPFGDRRMATASVFTEIITRCGELKDLRSSREITADFLNKVAAGELLGRCGFQTWRLPSDLPATAVVSAIADGLERGLGSRHDKSANRVLVLDACNDKEADLIQSSSPRFRSEYGLELRCYADPRVMTRQPGRSMEVPPLQGPVNLFSSEFINSVASSLDEFDAGGLFRPDGDIDFERDFGQWFNPNDVNGLDMR